MFIDSNVRSLSVALLNNIKDIPARNNQEGNWFSVTLRIENNSTIKNREQ